MKHVIGPYASSKKRRFGVMDLLVSAAVAAGAVWFLYRSTLGPQYSWNWSVILRYSVRLDPVSGRYVPGVLLNGFLTTIKLSFWSGILALLIGLFMGIFSSWKRPFARMISRTYVEFARNTPPLVLIFLFYFFLGDQITRLLGLELWIARLGPGGQRILTFLASSPQRFPAFVSAVITLGIFEGAYLTEIVRAGIESVDKGQREAAYALGLSLPDRYRFIILPQAVKTILPAAAGQFISIIKDSAIVAVISIPELTFQGLEVMAATYRTFEIWITIALMYFFLTSFCSWGAHAIERRLQKHH